MFAERSELGAALVVYAQRNGLVVDDSHGALELRTPCARAFVYEYPAEASFLEFWRQSEESVERIVAKASEESDVYLVLLVDASMAPPRRDLQTVATNEYRFRKVPLLVDPQRPEVAFEDLPFVGLKVLKQARGSGGSKYLSRMVDLGVRPRVAAECLTRTGDNELINQWLAQEPEGTHQENIALGPFGNTSGTYRLRNIELRGFRGLGSRYIDLSRDVVIIFGPNGSGKTSIVESIAWALGGNLLRFGSNADEGQHPIRPLWGKEETAADLRLEGSLGGHVVRRTVVDGAQWDGQNVNDRTLLRKLVRRELPEGWNVPRLREALCSAHVLFQEKLHDFIDGEAVAQSSALSALIGTEDFARAEDKMARVLATLAARLRDTRARIANLRGEYETVDNEIRALGAQLQRISGGKAKDVAEWLGDILREARDLGLVDRLDVELTKSDRDSSPEVPPSLRLFSEDVREETAAAAAREGRLRDLKDVARRLTDLRSDRARTAATLAEARKAEAEAHAAHDTLRSEWRKLSEGYAALQAELESSLERQRLCERLVARLDHLADIQRRRGEIAEERARLGEISEQGERSLDEQRLVVVQLEREVANFIKKSEEAAAHRTRQELLEGIARRWMSAEQRRGSVKGAMSEAVGVLDRSKVIRDRLRAGAQVLKDVASRAREAVAKALERLGNRRGLGEALRQYAVDECCPFCGADWGSAEALREAVDRILGEQPEDVVRLSAESDADEARSAKAQEALREANEVVTRAEAQVTQLKESLEEAERQVAEETSAARRAGYIASTPPTTADVATLVDDASEQEDALRVNALAANLASTQVGIGQLERSLQGTRRQLAEAARSEAALGEEEQGCRRDLDQAGISSNADDGRRQLDERRTRAIEEQSTLQAERQRVAVAMEGVRGTGETARSRLAGCKSDREEAERHDEAVSGAMHADEGRLVAERLSRAATPEEVESAARDEGSRVGRLSRLQSDIDAWERWAQHGHAERRLGVLAGEARRLRNALGEELEIERRESALEAELIQADGKLRSARGAEEFTALAERSDVVNRVFRRLNVSPLFTGVRIASGGQGNGVKVEAILDPRLGSYADSVSPKSYLSFAQLNAVGVSLFLAHSWLQDWTTLRTVVMDDPVQSMDDLNIYGFVDLLRSIVDDGRQMVVTTSNRDFFELAKAKFSCLNGPKAERFLAYELDSLVLGDEGEGASSVRGEH